MRKIMFLFLLLGIVFKLQAQETISGVISDEFGTLEGANILIKNSKMRTVSNAEGYFEINANKGDTLQVSYLGYQTKEILFSNKKDIKVLMSGSEALDEVVVVGYSCYRCRSVCCCIGVTKVVNYFNKEKPKTLVLYPNSSPSGLFNLKILKAHKTVQVNVSNMSGQLVKQVSSQNLGDRNLNIDLSQFPTGMYLVNIIADGKRIATKKAIKG